MPLLSSYDLIVVALPPMMDWPEITNNGRCVGSVVVHIAPLADSSYIGPQSGLTRIPQTNCWISRTTTLHTIVMSLRGRCHADRHLGAPLRRRLSRHFSCRCSTSRSQC